VDLEEIEYEAGFISLRQRPVLGCCEHGNEPSGFIKLEVVLDHLSNH
jgi:hypothetical protein